MAEVERDRSASDSGFNLFGDESNKRQSSDLDGSLFYQPSESGDSLDSLKRSGFIESTPPVSTDMDSVSLSRAYDSMKPVLPCPHSRDDITQAAHQLIDDINSKRKQDTQLLEDFKKALELQVQRTCSIVENQMTVLYEKQGKIIEDKIQELFACLDRIAKVESELQEFKQALQILYQDMNSA